MSENSRLRVIKLGGSLLHWSDVAEELRRWMGRQPAMTNLIVTGGGVFAEQVRDMDCLFNLSAEVSHRLAVEAMAINAHLLQALLPEARLLVLSERVGDWKWRDGSRSESATASGLTEALSHQCDDLGIVEPIDFVQRVDVAAMGNPLPVGWHVTSDSIAARVAEVLDAQELVLLKSALPQDAASADFVDEYFPIAAARLANIRFVNLRNHTFPECGLD